jgi:hypothetical protein
VRNILRGVPAGDAELPDVLQKLPGILQEDLKSGNLAPETVISAADRLSHSVRAVEVASLLKSSGMGEKQAFLTAERTLESLKRASLEEKLRRELGSTQPFAWTDTGNGIYEKYAPLGVLVHIAAGNAAGLPAVSVLEGLLAGNINLLKLPADDGGLSALLLYKLVAAEPSLKPYIYVFDIPSSDTDDLKKIAACADAVAVWGSDAAVAAIRKNTPPNIPVIEWGHRLSFGYVTQKSESEAALEGLAKDICETEQLLCSAPQCVFFEAEDRDGLMGFAGRFAKAMKNVCAGYPAVKPGMPVQAEITSALELVRMEEILGEKALLRGKDPDFGVLVDFKAAMKPSPMFRNVWVMPARRDGLFELLRGSKGYLQTAGLCCAEEERMELAELLVKAGVNRIMPPGEMSGGYMGEPHDGAYALTRYTRRISMKK